MSDYFLNSWTDSDRTYNEWETCYILHKKLTDSTKKFSSGVKLSPWDKFLATNRPWPSSGDIWKRAVITVIQFRTEKLTQFYRPGPKTNRSPGLKWFRRHQVLALTQFLTLITSHSGCVSREWSILRKYRKESDDLLF